jgi:hypothetical protein
VDPGGTRGEDRAARVLAERARELAKPPPGRGEESVPVLAFVAGPERYGLTLDAVIRIERVGAVARIPGAPPEVVGVFAVDGRPCPLVDVAVLLGASAAAGPPRRWGILLGRRAPEIALAADGIDLDHVPRAALTGEGPRLGVTGDARIIVGSAELVSAPAARRVAP